MRSSQGLVFGVFFSTLLLTACGSESDGSYIPTRDTVSTEGRISFNAAAKQIIIEEAGPTDRSDLITPCEISFVSLTLNYKLESELILDLNSSDFRLVNELTDVTPTPGVPRELFAVWRAEPQTFEGGVSNQIEIEIRPSSMIYRNICLR